MQLVTTWQNHESILIAMMLLYHGGYSGTTWIYNHFPSHIKYLGSHIAIVPTKFWNNCNLLGGLTTQAQQWLNFDAVLADFPLAYKHSNLNFRHCNLVQPSSKLAAEALLSETGNKPICIKYFVIVCFLSTHLFIYVYKRADKNFEIQTNVVLGKNKRTNISKKKSNMQFSEV